MAVERTLALPCPGLSCVYYLCLCLSLRLCVCVCVWIRARLARGCTSLCRYIVVIMAVGRATGEARGSKVDENAGARAI